MKTTLIVVVSILAASWMLQAQKPQQGVNAVQWTGPDTGTACSTTDYTDTDLKVTITTSGSPVQVAFNAGVNLGTNQGIMMRPAINGKAVDISSAGHFVGYGDMSTLAFSRIYNVPKGTHVITIQSACQGSVGIGLRWVSAMELK